MEYPEIETGIPFAEYPPTFEDLQARIDAAMRSIASVADAVEVADDDIKLARDVFAGGIKASDVTLSSPGVIVHIKALLTEYDHQVVQSAVQLRKYVTNRLIEDSGNPDPRIRLKCYELLGKISDVGLFTDKTEVTLRHRPTEELEQLLRERLVKTLDGESMRVPNPVPVPETITSASP